MNKFVDMSKFDELGDETLEQYLNKQNMTLGKNAEGLEELMHCISYCYVWGVITDSQRDQAYKKFEKQFKKALKEL
jgi:hypothetical protein